MYRVMIVDDEIGVRESLKAKINWNSLGFQIAAEASNGQEALSYMQQQKFDVVITDIQMPVMNGVQFFNECSSRYLNTKIIVLSGYSDFEYTKAAIKAGIVDYLIKPVARKELLELLTRIKEELDREKQEENQRKKEELATETVVVRTTGAIFVPAGQKRMDKRSIRAGSVSSIKTAKHQ